MSRIGKKLIEIPSAVKVEFDGQNVKVSGPKGELKTIIHRDIKAEAKDGKIFVSPKSKDASNKVRGLWGLYRALIFNMIQGVEKGFEKKLEIEGVGYKAAVQGDELVLNLGFVNPVKIKKPEGITFAVEKNLITISGINKEAVGQIAAEIRATKKAEPYKGKGIKYQGERIRRKEGKKVVAAKK
ncbi:MAG: 50S ribosomal protein L6 [Candidatus Staskawiczbacteria bacterium RIFCSPLOWO2_01_FULL_40_39]|uniref:Large ribosomal subunit protein uL6 n=1 Tax=Candidatus Staskawiczbacteria bacterium RIFCSPHIGHO2_01_FULL_39_25 TaxID=1802202 RepID=A0A1G2HQ58_9BACT|nr:MAG: 50S ribosomal protein L6 [Candidatus Staskawiczbacteria bacterium RIFCSPHIGHO2_01_FULL_39_25]OGZ72664.1 MAG: 50S ribosomal protein L6 [Candidatus Staskawiczbacteria bacterium RIFCSPLOWO2_01_FULL_40_39]OGZ75843.1 MAG: 50S ribosomal protein L6 [Candidatus Staskawiczbacteria bacterium RIFCSPLOWO2_02_FULL_39_8]